MLDFGWDTSQQRAYSLASLRGAVVQDFVHLFDVALQDLAVFRAKSGEVVLLALDDALLLKEKVLSDCLVRGYVCHHIQQDLGRNLPVPHLGGPYVDVQPHLATHQLLHLVTWVIFALHQRIHRLILEFYNFCNISLHRLACLHIKHIFKNL